MMKKEPTCGNTKCEAQSLYLRFALQQKKKKSNEIIIKAKE